jgi:branched-subunit amino acid ABC-type transport system permease component
MSCAGYSLFFNQTLRYINLAHNSITASAAFVIAVAIKKNQSVRYVSSPRSRRRLYLQLQLHCSACSP